MSKDYFSFKQFTVWHDKCAMKVGTDGVLLGAWAKVNNAQRILDLGCGTGLIALMAAQRNPTATITGIEIDEQASLQAQENVGKSPWNKRIHIVNEDANIFSTPMLFDCILSNPPFFQNSLKCPDSQRAAARHTDTLTFRQLMLCVSRLLAPEGEFSVVIPYDAREELVKEAIGTGLHLCRDTQVHTKPNAVPKRILLAFSRVAENTIYEHLTIETNHHEYTGEYRKLTSEFYLKM